MSFPLIVLFETALSKVSSFVVSSISSLLCLLLLGSSHLTSFNDWSWSILNMLFRAHTYQEAWNSDQLFSNSNVLLSDHDSSMMDWVSELSLEDDSLESSLHQLWECHTQDVIELLFILLEETETHHTTDQCITYNIIY